MKPANSDSGDTNNSPSTRGRASTKKPNLIKEKGRAASASPRVEPRSTKRLLPEKDEHDGSKAKRSAIKPTQTVKSNEQVIDLTQPINQPEQMEQETQEAPFTTVTRKPKKIQTGNYRATTSDEPTGEQKVFKITGMPGSKILLGSLLGFRFVTYWWITNRQQTST